MEEDKDGTKRNIGGGKANTKGTPQGGVISPLLANLYLGRPLATIGVKSLPLTR
jgi:retron-type reverse transcriptase